MIDFDIGLMSNLAGFKYFVLLFWLIDYDLVNLTFDLWFYILIDLINDLLN